MRGDLWPSAVLADNGRRGRRSALRAWLLCGLVIPLLSAVVLTPLPAGWAVDFAVSIWCALVVPFGIGRQRLHDIGRSGNLIWLVVAAPVLAFWVLPAGTLAAVTLPNPFGPEFAASVDAAGVVLTLLAVWTIAALPLLVWPGRRGPGDAATPDSDAAATATPPAA